MKNKERARTFLIKERNGKSALGLARVFPYNIGRYLDVYVTQMSPVYQLQGQDFLLILK